jgi:F-type H+-transporting ATPase subunit a
MTLISVFNKGLPLAAALLISAPLFASDEHTALTDSAIHHSETIVEDSHHEVAHKKEAFDPVPVIMHHISDSHEWHFWGKGEHSATIPLPVILYTDGSLDVFMSSAFDHGHAAVKKGDRVYSVDSHGHISEQSGLHPIDISITKNVASLFLSFVLLMLLFVSAAKSAKKTIGAPKGLLAFLEPLVVFVRDDIIIPNMGEKHHKKYLPYLMTIFFFILINNLLGLIPGGANVTGNIAVALVLSFLTLVITNTSGNKSYWKHIFLPPVPLALYPLMVPIEVIGILTKPFALMIRLFANITAGHIIILSLISLIFVFESLFIAPISVGFVLFMNTLELLVAALQAYIFTLLSSLFIGQAIQEHY